MTELLQTVAAWVVMPALFIAVVLVFIRLWRGPSLPDRVVAMDVLSSYGIGIAAAYAIANDAPVLLDIALILALISFLGTIAFAYYMDWRT